jgi:hypothetical protein
MANIRNINARAAFVGKDGNLTKYGVDTLLAIYGEIPGTDGAGSEVTFADLIAATEGSVTVHSDVTDAGSGQIITGTERSNITGSVTVHSDVTSAGSGQIITGAERALVGTALQPGTPPVITRAANTLTLDNGEGGSSSVSLFTATSIPFYLEDGTMDDISLVDDEIPFFLEDGTVSNIGLV